MLSPSNRHFKSWGSLPINVLTFLVECTFWHSIWSNYKNSHADLVADVTDHQASGNSSYLKWNIHTISHSMSSSVTETGEVSEFCVYVQHGLGLTVPHWGTLMGQQKYLQNSLPCPLPDLHIDMLLIRCSSSRFQKSQKWHYHRDLGILLWPCQRLHIIKSTSC